MRVWIPLLLLFWAFVWVVSNLSGSVEAQGFTLVDTRRVRLETREPAFDRRWDELLSAAVAEAPPFSALDPQALGAVTARIAALPFVAFVGEPTVVWPSSFEVEVRLRAPVACVLQGDHYLAVAADGMLLPGEHASPPWVENGFLPVIGPNDGSFARARAGQVLGETRHVDALAVAVSMREHLGAREFETMGPPLVDATKARQTSAEVPGVLIQLQERRVVLFGRAPDSGKPGELPTENKWSSVTRALRELAQRDWQVLDVRWDVPAIQWREPQGE